MPNSVYDTIRSALLGILKIVFCAHSPFRLEGCTEVTTLLLFRHTVNPVLLKEACIIMKSDLPCPV